MLAAPHATLSVRAESQVEVARARRARRAAGAWEAVRDRLRRRRRALLEPMQFLYESPHVETLPRARRLRREPSFARGRDAARRGARPHAPHPRAISRSTRRRPASRRRCARCSRKRRGVCQDFAHLMIGCLRTLGLAGALRERLHPHRAAARASRAWSAPTPRTPGCRSDCGRPRAGWTSIRPTTCVVDDEHVTLAWGRDFGDVTPMRGVILGGGEQELEVRVTVTPRLAVRR